MSDRQACVTGLCSSGERSGMNSACCAAIGNGMSLFSRKNRVLLPKRRREDRRGRAAGPFRWGGHRPTGLTRKGLPFGTNAVKVQVSPTHMLKNK